MKKKNFRLYLYKVAARYGIAMLLTNSIWPRITEKTWRISNLLHSFLGYIFLSYLLISKSGSMFRCGMHYVVDPLRNKVICDV